MYDHPMFVHRLFDHITDTMINVAHAVQKRQRDSGFSVNLFSCSNCVINMIAPEMYEEFVLPCDIKISKEFEAFGIHTCNWNATSYIPQLSQIERMGYIDMGIETDLVRMKKSFPYARRAVLYSPVKAENAPMDEIEKDFKKIAEELAPCDLVLADLETSISDEKVIKIIKLANNLAKEMK